MESLEVEAPYSVLANIGLYSYSAAAVAYVLLGFVIFTTQRHRPLTLPVVAACAVTAAWASTVAISTLLAYPQIVLIQVTELVRNLAWCFLLVRLMTLQQDSDRGLLASQRWKLWFLLASCLSIALVATLPDLVAFLELEKETATNLAFGLFLGLGILGMLLLEQVFRNNTEADRWSVKHLCLGLGIIFAYDFAMYAEALLFRALDANFWQARGVVTAMTAIFVAIGMARIHRSENSRHLYISRHVAFHSVTLLAAGTYLIAMAVVGYFIRYLGGSWGGVLQITFLAAAGLLLFALLFSGQIRARTRVWLSKNFFSYKYDYRVEWLRFTQTLAAGGGSDIPENIIMAVANLSQSPAGLLWSRSEEGRFNIAANWEMPEPDGDVDMRNLPDWLVEREWIIDLREWRRSPDLYTNLDLPEFLLDIPRAWLIVPLMFGDRLQGILLLRESDLQPDLNWEDRDLLKVAGRQAASHLAQFQAHQALIESRQFDAFNRLSAYVIHDLKNILAQQSLIVSNAEKHLDNPSFVESVIDTVRNSVERMTRLMEQMRSGERERGKEPIALSPLLKDVVSARATQLPHPELDAGSEDLWVSADKEHLTTVFTHIVQNAQEATAKDGKVSVRLRHQGDRAIVEVQDTGVGMDAQFLRHKLFKPFESTKGLTGMGIGAFESREFVRNLGGDIQVSSEPNAGSLFRIVLPCTEETIDTESTRKELPVEQQ